MRRNIWMIFAVLVTAALWGAGGVNPVAAQEEASAFPLPANTAYCEPGYAGPFDGCTPWDGVVVSYASEDGTFAESCTTVAGARTASCRVDVPFGSTITASIDPMVVPAGYVLEGASSRTFEIPAGPPEGQFGGPSFVLLPAESTEQPEPGHFMLTADTAYCEPGYAGPFDGCTPWEGVTVAFESTDAPISTTCQTIATSDRTASCGIPVPYGSTITVSIDTASVPAGFVLERSASQTIEIPAGPPDGVFGGAAFVLLPEADDPTPAADGVDPGSADGNSDGAPAEQPDGPGQDNGGVTALPNTGSGSAPDQTRAPVTWVALVAVALMVILGARTTRKLAR